MSADKTGLLTAFLGGLPGHVAARLARAVELDLLMDGKTLPHAEILRGLRPVLRREPCGRTLTPLRLFCLPFQELLSSEPRKTKQKGVIIRASLLALWRWLGQELLAEETQRFCVDVKTMLVAGQQEAALAEPKKARLAMEGDLAMADAVEMALLLSAAPEMMKIHALLPTPAPMTDELLWQLRAVYDELVTRLPDAAPYVPLVAMMRLSRPWEGLRLPLSIARQHRDTLISKTDMGLVGEILFSRLDSLQTAILTARHPMFDADKLLAETRQFAELSTAIVKEIEVRRDGEWGQRLLKDRAAVGAAMDKFMERAPRELAAALPVQRSGARNADFSRATDAEKREMAMRYARLVMGSRHFAAGACFAAKQKDALEEICAHLRRYNEDLVREMRAPEVPGVVEVQFPFATELTALLFSEEEAELLRRRGKAAQSASAA
ncbi:MAG: hypothetical protein JO256_01115 [Alphaproteobacteria bacterium]|nr:hypothetical protein [Alphaproteobacteria bacterium]